MTTKENFYKLIDNISDEEVLKSYLSIFQKLLYSENGEIYKSLNSDEKQELLLSYNESFDENNLIDHNIIKDRYKKWLCK